MSSFSDASTSASAVGSSTTEIEKKMGDVKIKDVFEWIRLEEERLTSQPPSMWDEVVEPNYEGKSLIFLEQFQKMHLSWTCRESEPDNTYIGSTRSANGVLVVHGAVENGDLPLLRALGYFNTNFNIQDEDNNRLTPLGSAIQLLNSYSDLSSIPVAPSGGKIGLPIIEWLLSRGVDTNISDKNGFSPLRLAVANSYHVNKKTTKDQKVWIDLCKLLLLHGANPKDLKHCSCDKMQAILTAYAKELSTSKTARPTPLCPCGKNVPVSECHGSVDGMSLHPKRYCFCKSKKLYGNCCLPRRFYYRESLTQEFKPLKAIYEVAEKAMAKHWREIVKKLTDKGIADEDIRKMNFIMGGIQESKEGIIALVEENKDLFDPCFRWCLTHKNNDFLYGRPWRLETTPVSKEEAVRRMEVWNGMVDEYIQDVSIADIRAGHTIERLNKISLQGAALWKNCGYCVNIEDTPSTFLFCSKCKMVCYCSAECQRTDWKFKHNKLCGENSQEETTPSCRAMGLVYNAAKALAV